MKLTTTVIPLTLLAATVAVSSVASAGLVLPHPVFVDTTNRHANGAMGDARYSSDGAQYIGCATYGSNPGGLFGLCSAHDAVGNYLMCQTYDSGLISQMQSVGLSSYIDFYADPSGYCTSVYVISESYMIH
jgi:hypothetical protein